MTDVADFYTGLVADLYEPLAGGITDSGRFIEFVKMHGEPALEICCGTGLPILDLLQVGLDVEGLDASGDMLEICKEKARSRELEVTLHHAKMQDFTLTRKFQSVYIANGSITLLSSDADLQKTLLSIRHCLNLTGAVLIDLDVPDVASLRNYVGKFRETGSEGYRLRVGMTQLDWDETSRKLVAALRYERIDKNGRVESVDRPWVRTIWNIDQFSERLINAGFEIRKIDEIGNGTIQISACLAD